LGYRFEKFCYRSADLIVTLSPGMKDEELGKLPQKKVISITNAANTELFSTLVRVDLSKYGLEPKIRAVCRKYREGEQCGMDVGGGQIID
jgi:hypothetical protein